jgi:hypothetical protein
VVSRTSGASPEAIQAVSDAYEDTIERYVAYQDHLVATGQLSGYELKTYRRRKRQSLLWTLLLDEVIETLPALHGDAPAELTRHIIEAKGVSAPIVAEEVARVLALGALVADQTAEGVQYRWAE